MADLIEELVEAGVHYGHQSRKWNPKMKPFLLQKRSGVHIINVEETALRLEEASELLSKVVLEGGKLLFVGCKMQAQEAVRQAAEACDPEGFQILPESRQVGLRARVFRLAGQRVRLAPH